MDASRCQIEEGRKGGRKEEVKNVFFHRASPAPVCALVCGGSQSATDGGTGQDGGKRRRRNRNNPEPPRRPAVGGLRAAGGGGDVQTG